MSTTPKTDDLVNRLRGIYVIPVNDGAGLLNGKNTVTRTFDNLPPIMGEAANEIERLSRQNAELLEALDSMVRQFAYSGNGVRTTGGLSALEAAFDALGLPDPAPLDACEMCDEPGCKEPITCGTPTPERYRHTCSKHAPPFSKLNKDLDHEP